MSKPTSKTLIIDAFKALMIAKPFDSIATSEIIDSSGISRSTFYKHFKDKYDLIEYITAKEILEYSFFEVDAKVSDREMAVLRAFSGNLAFYRHAFDSPYFRDFWQEQSVLSNVAELRRYGVTDPELLTFYANAIGSAFSVIEGKVLRGHIDISGQSLAAHFERLSAVLVQTALAEQQKKQSS